MFEPEKLHFNYIDLLGAPRRALKGKKIWAHLMGLVVGYSAYVILTYLALWVDGESLSTIWDRYGIYPFFSLCNGQLISVAGWIIYFLALLVWLMATLLAATVVVRITYKELKGDQFYTFTNGVTFVRRHWRTTILSPLSIILIIMFFLVMAVVMALIGKIPFLGEVIFMGLYPLYFLGAIFVLYTTVVLVVLILYLPAIIGIWEEDVMGCTFQAYAITWNQTWRAVVYSALIGVLVVVGTTLYGWVITAGYHFINWIFGSSWLMGSKLSPILAWAEQIVFSGYNYLFSFIPGQGAPLSPLTADVNLAFVSGWEAFMGSILAILLLFIYGSVFAYGFSIISVGQCLSFLIYKFKTDDENLLERKDEEELTEKVEEKEVSTDEAEQQASSEETDKKQGEEEADV
ncbi:MAG: hypothetical protein JSU77_00530 [Fidelibacterota bacterium]|nr:MAG: hypothetical protein JSU77_00530 [Candidatus Neomarinimicrobiota bacterium]